MAVNYGRHIVVKYGRHGGKLRHIHLLKMGHISEKNAKLLAGDDRYCSIGIVEYFK